MDIQSTLVISTSVILNNRLSRGENLVPALTWKSNNRQQNIVDKRRNCSSGAISSLSHNIFNINFNQLSLITYSFVKFGCAICIFLNPENLICRTTDISKYFRGSLQLRDNESLLY